MITNSKCLAIIQARMASTRLPGKSLADIHGRPMLAMQIARIKQSKYIDDIIVATTNDESDDVLVKTVLSLGVKVYRGPKKQVLTWYKESLEMALENSLDVHHVIRITGDCPLIDPDVIDRVIEVHVNRQKTNSSIRVQPLLYTSNVRPPTYPDGLDVEIMTVGTLDWLVNNCSSDAEQEHVTIGVTKFDCPVIIKNVLSSIPLGHLRWTVDVESDLAFVRAVHGRLGIINQNHNDSYRSYDILNLIETMPEISKINAYAEKRK